MIVYYVADTEDFSNDYFEVLGEKQLIEYAKDRQQVQIEQGYREEPIEIPSIEVAIKVIEDDSFIVKEFEVE